MTDLSPAAQAVRRNLAQIMHELQIKVDPSNIPNHIDVDI